MEEPLADRGGKRRPSGSRQERRPLLLACLAGKGTRPPERTRPMARSRPPPLADLSEAGTEEPPLPPAGKRDPAPAGTDLLRRRAGASPGPGAGLPLAPLGVSPLHKQQQQQPPRARERASVRPWVSASSSSQNQREKSPSLIGCRRLGAAAPRAVHSNSPPSGAEGAVHAQHHRGARRTTSQLLCLLACLLEVGTSMGTKGSCTIPSCICLTWKETDLLLLLPTSQQPALKRSGSRKGKGVGDACSWPHHHQSQSQECYSVKKKVHASQRELQDWAENLQYFVSNAIAT